MSHDRLKITSSKPILMTPCQPVLFYPLNADHIIQPSAGALNTWWLRW